MSADSSQTEGAGGSSSFAEAERLARALHEKVFLLREHMRACGLENATAAPPDPAAALQPVGRPINIQFNLI